VSCRAVQKISTALEVSHRPVCSSQLPYNMSIVRFKYCSNLNAPIEKDVVRWAPESAHTDCEWNLLSSRGTSKYLKWRRSNTEVNQCSVSNSSGLSLRIRVSVQSELLPNWRSRFPIYPKCQLGYSSMVISKPIWIGQVASGLPSVSIDRFI